MESHHDEASGNETSGMDDEDWDDHPGEISTITADNSQHYSQQRWAEHDTNSSYTSSLGGHAGHATTTTADSIANSRINSKYNSLSPVPKPGTQRPSNSRSLLWADNATPKKGKYSSVPRRNKKSPGSITSLLKPGGIRNTPRRRALRDVSNYGKGLSAATPTERAASAQRPAALLQQSTAASFSIAVDPHEPQGNTPSHLNKRANHTPRVMFKKVFSTFDPLHGRRADHAGYYNLNSPAVAQVVPASLSPRLNHHTRDSTSDSRNRLAFRQAAEDHGGYSDGVVNDNEDSRISLSTRASVTDDESQDEMFDMPCKSTRKHRRAMRAMIMGQIRPQYADAEDSEDEWNDVDDEDEDGAASESDGEGGGNDSRYVDGYRGSGIGGTAHLMHSKGNAQAVGEEDEEEGGEGEGEGAELESAEDSILMQWRRELEEEAHFQQEVQVPLVPKDVSSPGGRVSASTFSSTAEKAAELLELWNSLGVSYGARRRTLRALHVTAGHSSSPERLLQMMVDMKNKLNTMLQFVRREMAAVRRCDQLLREEDMTDLQAQQLPTLVAVLQRVLPKWETEQGRPFLFRGIRYLDLMPLLLKRFVAAK
jgi:hypothetical protein